MATKLTLRLDESVIRDAKWAARARGVSQSEMVSVYFLAGGNLRRTQPESRPEKAFCRLS